MSSAVVIPDCYLHCLCHTRCRRRETTWVITRTVVYKTRGISHCFGARIFNGAGGPLSSVLGTHSRGRTSKKLEFESLVRGAMVTTRQANKSTKKSTVCTAPAAGKVVKNHAPPAKKETVVTKPALEARSTTEKRMFRSKRLSRIKARLLRITIKKSPKKKKAGTGVRTPFLRSPGPPPTATIIPPLTFKSPN